MMRPYSESERENHHMKKTLSLFCQFYAFCFLTSCRKTEKAISSDDVVEISWWISRGEDSTYYMSYDDNPAIRYLETLEFNGKKVDLHLSQSQVLNGTTSLRFS